MIESKLVKISQNLNEFFLEEKGAFFWLMDSFSILILC